MRLCVLTTMIVAGFALCFTDMASAQGGRGRGGGDLMNLLRNDSVRGELEVVEEQWEEIEGLQEEMWSDMRERMSAVRDLEPEERREQFTLLREEMEERRGEYQEKIEGVLLPQQLKRLKELQIQSRARRSGEGSLGILQNDEILEELGIDEETREKLRKKSEQVLAELKQKVKKLQAKAEEEILSVLSSEQRKNFREKVGESFDFGSSQPGFAGRGGRGGNDRGRGRGGRPDADNDS